MTNPAAFMQFIDKAILFLNKLGLYSTSWPLRRLSSRVDNNALVLEVGSGGNPYPRSNVLVDAYEETGERHWEVLCKDRPTIIGFAENLPFKNKSFDYVTACHVLEHSNDPEKFLGELQRVAKAGYIEIPNALFERLSPYIDHKLEILQEGESLKIMKKSGSVNDFWFNRSLNKNVQKNFGKLMRKNPYLFHICFYWNESFAFEIQNPQEKFKANVTPFKFVEHRLSFVGRVKRKVLKFLGQYARTFPPLTPEIMKSMLRCPSCFSGTFSNYSENKVVCLNCSTEIKVFLSELNA